MIVRTKPNTAVKSRVFLPYPNYTRFCILRKDDRILSMLNLTEVQKKKIKEVGEKYGLKLLLLHGSYATGKERKDSDIDVAVLGRERLDYKALSKIYFGLESVLVDNLDKELDFKSLHGADPYFIYKVAKDSQLLFGKQMDYDEFRAYALKGYLDSKDLRNLEKRMVEKYQGYLNLNYA